MNKIDKLKKRQGLSYADIAQLAGVSATYIYLLAKDRRKNPSLEVMQKIAAALSTDVERVFDINVRQDLPDQQEQHISR